MPNDYKTFGFMNAKGDLEFAFFTDDDIRRGELRAHIDVMRDEGFTFIGEEVTSDAK